MDMFLIVVDKKAVSDIEEDEELIEEDNARQNSSYFASISPK